MAKDGGGGRSSRFDRRTSRLPPFTAPRESRNPRPHRIVHFLVLPLVPGATPALRRLWPSPIASSSAARNTSSTPSSLNAHTSTYLAAPIRVATASPSEVESGRRPCAFRSSLACLSRRRSVLVATRMSGMP